MHSFIATYYAMFDRYFWEVYSFLKKKGEEVDLGERESVGREFGGVEEKNLWSGCNI